MKLSGSGRGRERNGKKEKLKNNSSRRHVDTAGEGRSGEGRGRPSLQGCAPQGIEHFSVPPTAEPDPLHLCFLTCHFPERHHDRGRGVTPVTVRTLSINEDTVRRGRRYFSAWTSAFCFAGSATCVTWVSPCSGHKHALSCVENVLFPSSNCHAFSPICTFFPDTIADPNRSHPVFPSQPLVERVLCRMTIVMLPVPLWTTHELKAATLSFYLRRLLQYLLDDSEQTTKEAFDESQSKFFFPISVSLNHVLTPVCLTFPEGSSPLSS